MKNFHMTAPRLRVMLTISLFAITALAILIASFAYASLKDVAVQVSHTAADANASQNNIQTLQQIQQKLANDKEIVERANSIVADSQSYQYQDQILADLKDYAGKAGVTITDIDFSTTATTQTPATGTPQPAAPTGVKSTSVSVTLKNPIDYNSLLRFIKSIEQNLTKMQISKISLSKGTTGNDVSSEALMIEVYIR